MSMSKHEQERIKEVMEAFERLYGAQVDAITVDGWTASVVLNWGRDGSAVQVSAEDQAEYDALLKAFQALHKLAGDKTGERFDELTGLLIPN